jgi:hypothetical protein
LWTLVLASIQKNEILGGFAIGANRESAINR